MAFGLETNRSAWSEVDKSIAEQKYQTAMDQAEPILKTALAQNQTSLWTESLLKIAKLKLALHSPAEAVDFLQSTPWPANVESKIILHLCSAELLKAYFQVSSWQIEQREEKIESAPRNRNTISTVQSWTKTKIQSEILKHFRLALDLDKGSSFPLTAFFKNFLKPNTYPENVRPLTRDWIVYAMADHLSNTLFWSPEELNQRSAFRIPLFFEAKAKLKAPLDLHPWSQVSQLLSSHREFHRKFKRTDAALETQYKLAQILNSTVEDSIQKKLLIQQLEKLQKNHSPQGWWAHGQALLSQFYAQSSEPGNLVKARAAAQAGAETTPANPASLECQSRVENIDLADIQILTMDSDLPQKESFQLSYKNLEKFYLRGYALDLKSYLSRPKTAILKYDSSLFPENMGTPLLETEVNLPKTKDFDFHKKLVNPGIDKPGTYLIVGSRNQTFSSENNSLVRGVVQVSRIVMERSRTPSGDLKVRVLTLTEGSPVKNAKVNLYSYRYTQTPKLLQTQWTPTNGEIVFSLTKEKSHPSNFILLAEHNDSSAYAEEGIFLRESPKKSVSIKGLIYTDRTYYRPEQKVLWKVAVYQTSSDKSSLDLSPAGTAISVSLIDANGQKIDTRNAMTNSFGTASGEFSIPKGRSLGSWKLKFNDSIQGSATIYIEEYKRPHFYVELDAGKKPLKLNKTAKVRGLAKYYHGGPLNQATISWKVNRVQQPIWTSQTFSLGPWAPIAPEVVAFGKTRIDSQGQFTISFDTKAPPKRWSNIDENQMEPNRQFLYEIFADVLDSGGETQSTQLPVLIGDVSRTVKIQLPSEGVLSNSKTNFVRLELTTGMGKPISGKGRVQIFSLKSPRQTLLPSEIPLKGTHSPFSAPDDFRRARWEHWVSWEEVAEFWKNDGLVLQQELQHSSAGIANLELPSHLPAGAYQLKYYGTDDFGSPIEQIAKFLIAEEKKPVFFPLIFSSVKTDGEMGTTLKLLLGSGFQNQPLLLETYQAGSLIEEKKIISDGQWFRIHYPITEKHKGGFTLVASLLRDAQMIRKEITISVPWTKPSLELEISPKAKQLRPGEKSSFTIQLKPGSTAPEDVELLAYMYDASLDSYGPHLLPSLDSLFPHKGGAVSRTLSLGFSPLNYWMGETKPPVSPPYFSSEDFQFYDAYGTGGLGNREGFTMMTSADTKGALHQEAQGLKRSAVSAPRPQPLEKASVNDVARRDFSESAFFLPHLKLSKAGSTQFEFRLPDSLTKWKLNVHGLSRGLASGYASKEIEARKELMIHLATPRFLRELDSAKIHMVVQNAGNEKLTFNPEIEIFDTAHGISLEKEFKLEKNYAKAILIQPGESRTLQFSVKVPKGPRIVEFRAAAKSESHSDQEIRQIPILPVRLQLVESKFIALTPSSPKAQIQIESMLTKNADASRTDEKLVVSGDGNLFYALIDAIPSLIKTDFISSDSLANRLLAIGILNSIYSKNPHIADFARKASQRRKVVSESKATLQPFNFNDANRKILLEETPFLQLSEGLMSEKHSILDVLNADTVRVEVIATIKKLRSMQLDSGGFPWIEGGPPDPFMTLSVLKNLARAEEFGISIPQDMVAKAWGSIDKWLVDELKRVQNLDCCWEMATLSHYIATTPSIQKLKIKTLRPDFLQQLLTFSFKHWKRQSPLLKSFLSLSLLREGRKEDSLLVWNSVMDSARATKDAGVHWAPESQSWMWYNDTIESHAIALQTNLVLRPFDPLNEGLVQWLFLNKKLNQWKSTRATAEVLYAVHKYLLANSRFPSDEKISAQIGSTKTVWDFNPTAYDGKKNQWVIEPVNFKSQLELEISPPGFGFASANYFFSSDQYPKSGSGDLYKIERSYYLRKLTKAGYKLIPVSQSQSVKVGEEVEVELKIVTQHPSEYIWIRDPRAAGFEPEKTISGFRWDTGLSYFEEPRDTATLFFMSKLPAGHFSLKYRLRATTAGTFKIAPAELQSIYSPEFSARTGGENLTILP